MRNTRTDVTSRVKRSTVNTSKNERIQHEHDDEHKPSKNTKQIVISIFSLILFIFCAWVTFAKYNDHVNNIPNNISLNEDEQINSKKVIPPWLAKKQQPSIIIVASINGGTSTLNQILMFYFKHFFHGFRETQDLYYWLACVPQDWITHIGSIYTYKDKQASTNFKEKYNELKSNPSANYKSWSTTQLRYRGCRNKDNPSDFHCDLSCSHEGYMDHIGYKMSDKYKHIYFANNNEYKQYLQSSDRDNRYPNESYNDIHFYWDRTSGYNSLPYIPVVLSTNYPKAKLLYIVRDPLTQMYSRIRQFDEITHLQKPKKQLDEGEANRRFGQLVDFIESDHVNDILLPLLKNNEQNELIEDSILMWYVTLWAINGLAFKDDRTFDICPYINILMFIKTGQYYNKENGFNNFGLIQFEWMTNNKLLESTIYMYCWTVFDEKENGNNCVGKYTQNHYENLDEIMWNWKSIEQNSHWGKLKDYEWNFTELKTFDKLIEFFNLCDLRLMGLLEKYPVLLGEFQLNLWTDHRNEIRQKILDKQGDEK